MREMKFRAWHKIFKNYAHIKRIWLDGDGNGHDEIFAVSDVETTYPIHEVVLEQYTGLKDKNGKEIYEGDIVDYNDDGDCLGVVKYIAPRFEIMERNGFTCWLKGAPHQRVIGNIHENPELCGEEEE